MAIAKVFGIASDKDNYKTRWLWIELNVIDKVEVEVRRKIKSRQ
jgi:hypothetical protein